MTQKLGRNQCRQKLFPAVGFLVAPSCSSFLSFLSSSHTRGKERGKGKGRRQRKISLNKERRRKTKQTSQRTEPAEGISKIWPRVSKTVGPSPSPLTLISVVSVLLVYFHKVIELLQGLSTVQSMLFPAALIQKMSVAAKEAPTILPSLSQIWSPGQSFLWFKQKTYK